MLVEFDTLETNNPRGFQKVTQLIAYLMRHQFVHAEDRGAAALLETLHRPEFVRLIEAISMLSATALCIAKRKGGRAFSPIRSEHRFPA
jgi:hypothetical protein